MSEQNADLAFLRGMPSKELGELIANKDERIMRVLADPELKKELRAGNLTRPPDDPAPAPPADPTAVADPPADPAKATPAPPADPAPADPNAPPANPYDEEAKKRGFKDTADMMKKYDEKAAYIGILESQRDTLKDDLNARAGAEGGPLGQKVKEMDETIALLKAQLLEAKRSPAAPQDPPIKEVLELYRPNLADEIKPDDYSDPAMARIVKKHQDEIKRMVDDLSGKLGRLSPASVQKQMQAVMAKNDELQTQINVLIQKDELRENRVHDQEAQDSFNTIYGETDAFLKGLGIKTTMSFGELDRAIARSGPAGSEARTVFLRSLPDGDRQAWETAIPLLNRYGHGVDVPTNGGRGKIRKFVKYGNIESLKDLYDLELLRSGKLDAEQKEKLLAAHRQGAQSVADSTRLPPGVKGLPDAAITGEKLPAEATFDAKQKRLKELTAMGTNLMKDKKLFDEFKTLKAEMYREVKSQMAQGTFKRKK
jgi:hypothetical protein